MNDTRYLKFVANGKRLDDYTHEYKFILKCPCTFEELAKDIIKSWPDEWGYIGVYDYLKHGWQSFGNPHFEYFQGHFVNEHRQPIHIDFGEYGDRLVKDVFITGGWTRMDILVGLEEKK